jgi:hypothetical protein
MHFRTHGANLIKNLVLKSQKLVRNYLHKMITNMIVNDVIHRQSV